MAEGTMIDMGDGFGGMSLLSGGAGFVGGLVLGSLWNGNGPWGGRLLRGKIAEQDVIDIGAIGLALLLRKIPE